MVCAYKGIKFVVGDTIKKREDDQCLEPPLTLEIIWVSYIEAFCDERTGDFQGSFYFFLFIFFFGRPIVKFQAAVVPIPYVNWLPYSCYLGTLFFPLDSKSTILGLTSTAPTSIPLPSYVRYLSNSYFIPRTKQTHSMTHSSNESKGQLWICHIHRMGEKGSERPLRPPQIVHHPQKDFP